MGRRPSSAEVAFVRPQALSSLIGTLRALFCALCALPVSPAPRQRPTSQAAPFGRLRPRPCLHIALPAQHELLEPSAGRRGHLPVACRRRRSAAAFCTLAAWPQAGCACILTVWNGCVCILQAFKQLGVAASVLTRRCSPQCAPGCGTSLCRARRTPLQHAPARHAGDHLCSAHPAQRAVRRML